MAFPKSILYITHRDKVIGGGEISLFELIKGLDRRDFHPFLAMSGGIELPRLAGESGATPIRLDLPPFKIWKIPGIFLSLFRLVSLLYGEKIDILHANTSRAMIYAGIAAKMARKPVVWHVRITDKDPLLDPVLYYLADIVLCNSRATASRFSGYGKQEKIKIVHNGLDPSKYRNAVERKIFRDIPPPKKIVLNVGRLEPFKGQDAFLEMAGMVKARYPEVLFVLVGEDAAPQKEYFKRLERMAEVTGLRDSVLFLGDQKNVPDILGEADIVVSTSKKESFGRALLEAAASQKPVAAFDVGGVREVVEDQGTGFLVKEGDIQGLAEKVLILLTDDKLRDKMGGLGRKKVLAEFTSDLHARRVEEIYRDLK
jgi:glycosyltransferase involved in cell wall biosynthesis